MTNIAALVFPLLTVTLVLAGVAILLARSWGYWLAYAILFSSLQNPRVYFLFFLNGAHDLLQTLFHFRVSIEFIDIGINLFAAGVFGWAQFVLSEAELLDRVHSEATRRRMLRACQIISTIAMVLPLLLLFWLRNVDPPGHNPGGFDGGYITLFTALTWWPFELAGIAGLIVSSLLVRKSRSPK